MGLTPEFPRLDAADYKVLLVALAPPDDGGILTSDPDLDSLLDGLAEEWARVDNRVADMVDEADPRTVTETIDAWERVLGLPDPCDTTPPTTLADRRDAVLAKLTGDGGQNAAYYIRVAEALTGPTVTVIEWPYPLAARCAVARCGDGLGSEGNVFYWQLIAPAATPAAVRVRLECIINRIKPAHTVAEYLYTN